MASHNAIILIVVIALEPRLTMTGFSCRLFWIGCVVNSVIVLPQQKHEMSGEAGEL